MYNNLYDFGVWCAENAKTYNEIAKVVNNDRKWVKANKFKFADIEPNWTNPIAGDARVPMDDNTDAADNDELEQFSDIDADDST